MIEKIQENHFFVKISLFTICTQVPSRELLCIMVFLCFLTVLFIERQRKKGIT